MAARSIFLISLLLSVFMVSLNAAVEQDFEISKKLSGFNQGPRMAVNSKTGDVLVVWSNWKLGIQSDISIYMALCKRKSNGSYKVSKARQVSPKTHLSSLADVAYNPEDNSYLVAWSASLQIGETSGDSELFIRKISSSGKAKGSARNISNNSRHHDRSPMLCYAPGSGASAPAGKGGYMLVWTSRSRVGGELQLGGLFSILLDQDGKAVGSPQQVRKYGRDADGYSHRKFMSLEDGNFLLATLFRVKLDPHVEVPMLIKIRNNGNFLRETALDKKYGFSFAAVNLSKKLIFSFWRTEKSAKYQGARASNLKTLKIQKVSGIPTIAFKNEMVKLGSDPGACHIFSVFDSLYGHYIGVRGKPEGKPEYLFQSENYIYDLVAAPVTDTNEVFVVMAVSNDLVKEEVITAFVFDPLDRSPLE